jgi:hypothetical protein
MLRCFAFLLGCLLVVSAVAEDKPKSDAKTPNPIPVISGDLGECTADFTVTGTKLHPIYGAKLEVEIRYGFAGFRRTNLEIYTNVDGKARVEGLPERSKNPLSFTASFEGRKTVVIVDPEQKCHGDYQAIVTDRPVKTDE